MCARCHLGPGCQLPFMDAKAQEGSGGLLMSHGTIPHPQATATVTPRVPRRDGGIKLSGSIPHCYCWCPTWGLSLFSPPYLVSGGSHPAAWAPQPLGIQSRLAFSLLSSGAGGNGSHSCVSVLSANSGHVLDLCGQGTYRAG